MSIPTGEVPVPDAVARLAGNGPATAVWANQVGGLTFKLDRPARFVKWLPWGSGESLRREALKLSWAVRYICVPDVLAYGADLDAEWMVTAALPGRSAVDPHWLARPQQAAHAAGAGLRALHEALPVSGCPFAWDVSGRIARARAAGTAIPAELENPPAIDRLVVCHGDPCVPNTLLDDGGDPVAHLDLGSLGTADRWADLAAGSWSVDWNYGPGYQDAYFAGYGTDIDAERLAYYRALWEAA